MRSLRPLTFSYPLCVPSSLPSPHHPISRPIRWLSSNLSPPPLTFFYSDHYKHPLPPKHRFPMHKYTQIRHLLQAHPLLKSSKFIPAPLARRLDLELVHTRHYVTSFLGGTLPETQQRDIGFPWSLRGVRRALGSTGGTVAAVRGVMNGDGQLTGHLAGGTHHAKKGGGAGFCVFNDLAVGVMVARREFGVKRICVMDLDVHQGDGSAEILGGVDGVATVSVHCQENWPWKKEKSWIDIGLEEGIEDERYLEVVERTLKKVGGGWDLVMMQMGVDGLKEDKLGRWKLSRDGLRRRNEMVYKWVLEMGSRGVVTMGGGYAEPIEESVQAHADVYVDAVRAVQDLAI